MRADPPLSPVPYAQVEVFRVLEQTPDLSVRGVVDTLEFAPKTVSTFVRALVEVGHVRQTPERGRATRLRLTVAARAAIDMRDERRAVVLHAVLRRVDPADRDAISRAVAPLLKLQEELEAASASGT